MFEAFLLFRILKHKLLRTLRYLTEGTPLNE
uniref:Uncharacterized protein n=1 Tax=Arundo donax TaxID=35708 RepID=A0A0A9ALM5_ARUDO